MGKVTDADREAAKALRDILAEASGFWHNCGDDSMLCLALARHRVEAEKRALDRSIRYGKNPLLYGYEALRSLGEAPPAHRPAPTAP